MLPQWMIEKKRDGLHLTTEEIQTFIRGYTDGTIPDYQMAALAMAIYFRGMSPRETADLTIAMMESGTVIDPTRIPGRKVDKHSTGGIGDKISIPLAPLVAACGAKVPMISGRGLGITGGTLDKLESIHGYRVNLSEKEFFNTLQQCGCSLIGQTDEICPADKKLYALRDVTATVPSIPLIVASIMSKKMAEGIDALVLDVKCGAGAFMKTRKDAQTLAKALVATGESLGRKTTALLTNMDQPLGRTVGNSLEIQESIDILNNNGPDDVRQLTLELAAHMLLSVNLFPDLDAARQRALTALADGSALHLFENMVQCHGGDLSQGLPRAQHTVPLEARQTGQVQEVNADLIGRAVLLLGAGRTQTTDTIDPAVGLSDLVKTGEEVRSGDPLCILHFNDHNKAKEALELLTDAFKITNKPVTPPELIYEIIRH
jgi:pyrimidine-nucleoside phosphorylase